MKEQRPADQERHAAFCRSKPQLRERPADQEDLAFMGASADRKRFMKELRQGAISDKAYKEEIYGAMAAYARKKLLDGDGRGDTGRQPDRNVDSEELFLDGAATGINE